MRLNIFELEILSRERADRLGDIEEAVLTNKNSLSKENWIFLHSLKHCFREVGVDSFKD